MAQLGNSVTEVGTQGVRAQANLREETSSAPRPWRNDESNNPSAGANCGDTALRCREPTDNAWAQTISQISEQLQQGTRQATTQTDAAMRANAENARATSVHAALHTITSFHQQGINHHDILLSTANSAGLPTLPEPAQQEDEEAPTEATGADDAQEVDAATTPSVSADSSTPQSGTPQAAHNKTAGAPQPTPDRTRASKAQAQQSAVSSANTTVTASATDTDAATQDASTATPTARKPISRASNTGGHSRSDSSSSEQTQQTPNEPPTGTPLRLRAMRSPWRNLS